MSLFNQLTDVVTSQATSQVAQKAGIDSQLAAKMMPMVMGALMGGLKKNTSEPQGAEALASALDKHDGGLLNNLADLSNDDVMADGRNILGHILGGKQEQTVQALAKTAGVDTSRMGDLLAMSAPALLAALGKTKNEQGLDSAGLAGLVTEEATKVQQEAPSALTGLMSFLDEDGDGDFKDDLLEAAGKSLLGGLFGRK
ncbi:MAG: DUF937 domain-containing protein [Pseudomonadota bacterium]